MSTARWRRPRVRQASPLLGVLGFLATLFSGCATAGSTWITSPLVAPDEEEYRSKLDAEALRQGEPRAPLQAKGVRPIGDAPEDRWQSVSTYDLTQAAADAPAAERPLKTTSADGRLLGVFRNTYYDFPSEQDFSGASTSLMDASCHAIAQVPVGFHDAVCVQGSGTLSSGETVSFAKRDCECARTCPRTGQKICFDRLSRADFPWGRGALGKPITPLLSVAVDSAEIPLGTAVYIPEFDGVARDDSGTPHDGCFIAQDRGMKVKGKHVDVFTGLSAVTKRLNKLVPSNRGVHVYVDTARCARGAERAPQW